MGKAPGSKHRTLAAKFEPLLDEQRAAAVLTNREALLERFRHNGWTAEVMRDGIVVDDNIEHPLVYFRLKMPGAAAVIVRGGLAELVRKSKGMAHGPHSTQA